MARWASARPVRAAEEGIPGELYWGLAPDAFDRSPEIVRRTGETAAEAEARWRKRVREMGWTVSRLREAAPSDERLQSWLAFWERKRRIIGADRG